MKLLLLLVFLPLLAYSVTGRTDTLPTPGRHRLTLSLETGQTVRFSLSMPKVEQGSKAPLILALHYGGEVTPWISMPFLEVLAAPAFGGLSQR